jgi:hypothetical protein
MEVIKVQDPKDRTYPFAQNLYDDMRVVYHGTSSAFATTIEANGFMRGQLPFSITSLRKLVSLADEIGFRSWHYTTVKGLSSGKQLFAETIWPVYFSANFWYARDYATSLGGETIHNAILLSKELLNHLQPVEGSNSSTSAAVQELYDYLKSLIANSFPIVYAVRIEPEWLQHESSLERRNIGLFVVTEVNIECLRSVPANRLMAKVEYVHGAESGYVGPQPATWLEARRFGQG